MPVFVQSVGLTVFVNFAQTDFTLFTESVMLIAFESFIITVIQRHFIFSFLQRQATERDL
jgi:hypothetical protein